MFDILFDTLECGINAGTSYVKYRTMEPETEEEIQQQKELLNDASNYYVSGVLTALTIPKRVYTPKNPTLLGLVRFTRMSMIGFALVLSGHQAWIYYNDYKQRCDQINGENE